MTTVFDQVVRTGALAGALLWQDAALPQTPTPEKPGPAPATRPDLRTAETIGAIKNTLQQLERIPGLLSVDARTRIVESLNSSEKNQNTLTGEPRKQLDAALEKDLLILNDLLRAGMKERTAVPAKVAVYSLEQYQGLKLSSGLLRSMMEEQISQAGRKPSEMEQRVMRGLSKINDSTDPEDLTKRLEPDVRGLADVLLQSKGSGREQIEQLLRAGRGPAASEKPGQPAVESTLEWYKEWKKLLDKDKSPPLGRERYEQRRFNELVSTERGVEIVRTDAGTLSKKAGLSPELKLKLAEIVGSEEMPRDALETMKRASLPEPRAK